MLLLTIGKHCPQLSDADILGFVTYDMSFEIVESFGKKYGSVTAQYCLSDLFISYGIAAVKGMLKDIKSLLCVFVFLKTKVVGMAVGTHAPSDL